MNEPSTLATAYSIGLGIKQSMASAGFHLKKVVVMMDGREVTFNYGDDDGLMPQSTSSVAPPPLPAVKMPVNPRVLAPPAPPSVSCPPPPPPPPPLTAAVAKGVERPIVKEEVMEPSLVPESERALVWCIPPYGEPWPPYAEGCAPTHVLKHGPRPPLLKPLPYGMTLPPNPPIPVSDTVTPVTNKRHLPVEGVTPYTDDDPCPFKKHKGTRMGDLPADYLDYLAGWDRLRKIDPRFWAYIIRHRDVIDQEMKRNERKS
jgi:hypothetical protein